MWITESCPRGQRFALRPPCGRPAGSPVASSGRGYQPVETQILLKAKRDMPQGTALLTGARIVTMKGDEVIEHGDILVRNNRIAAIRTPARRERRCARTVRRRPIMRSTRRGCT